MARIAASDLDIPSPKLHAKRPPGADLCLISCRAGFHRGSARCPDPAPVAEKHDFTEERRLEGKRIEAGHVAVRIVSGEPDGIRQGVDHVASLAGAVRPVQ